MKIDALLELLKMAENNAVQYNPVAYEDKGVALDDGGNAINPAMQSQVDLQDSIESQNEQAFQNHRKYKVRTATGNPMPVNN